MKLLRFLNTAALLAAFGAAGQAQVGDFTIERVLTLKSISSPTAPSFPATVLAALESGALEVHQQFIYKSATRMLEQNAFVVPGGSPVPFPSPASAPVADHYIMRVDSAVTTAQPGPSAVLTGKVLSNSVPTPWGDITGAVIALSFGYQGTGGGVTFTPIYEAVSPLYGLYTASGVGAFSSTASAQKCSTATLNGTYMFHLSGSIQTQSSPVAFGPYTDDGVFIADGQGNITVTDAGNVGGSAFQGRTFPIAYVIGDDCTGTFQFAGAVMSIQVAKDGTSLNMVFTYPSAVIANGSGKLQ
jgi:hypothetical protein